eukprot:gene975-359_t
MEATNSRNQEEDTDTKNSLPNRTVEIVRRTLTIGDVLEFVHAHSVRDRKDFKSLLLVSKSFVTSRNVRIGFTFSSKKTNIKDFPQGRAFTKVDCRYKGTETTQNIQNFVDCCKFVQDLALHVNVEPTRLESAFLSMRQLQKVSLHIWPEEPFANTLTLRFGNALMNISLFGPVPHRRGTEQLPVELHIPNNLQELLVYPIFRFTNIELLSQGFFDTFSCLRVIRIFAGERTVVWPHTITFPPSVDTINLNNYNGTRPCQLRCVQFHGGIRRVYLTSFDCLNELIFLEDIPDLTHLEIRDKRRLDWTIPYRETHRQICTCYQVKLSYVSQGLRLPTIPTSCKKCAVWEKQKGIEPRDVSCAERIPIRISESADPTHGLRIEDVIERVHQNAVWHRTDFRALRFVRKNFVSPNVTVSCNTSLSGDFMLDLCSLHCIDDDLM